MMLENVENKTDHIDHIQTDINNTMAVDTHTINMNSKLIDNSIIELCDKMDLRIVQELSLCFNRLPCVPNNFAQHLSNVEKLDLSHNNLKELPSSFSLLTKLQHLKMDHNEFQSLPTVLAGIKSLKSLNISHNKIEQHSEDLGSLFNLEILNLSWNNLSKLPYSFMRLNRLCELNLAGNKFAIIPECIINGMRNLEMLDLSLNKSIILNVAPCSRRLRKFYAMQNGICRTFPRWILTPTFSALEEVNFNETEFLKFKFPRENALLNLKSLSITQSTLSDSILEELTRNMIKLEKMDVGNEESKKEGNIFCNLPTQQLKNPQLVKEIYMQRTGLPLMSRSVKDLRNVTVMDLGKNTVAWLPDEFCLLQKLEVLIIDNNSLSTLPDNFGNLIALKVLILSCNQLSSLPASMSNLKKLCLLDLYDNNLLEIPWDVVNLENIQGLDIECNFFATDDSMIRNISYETLRKSIHERYASFSQRIIGAKVPVEESEHSNSVSSNSSLKSEFYRESDDNPTDQISFFNEEENWDLSEDSTEEYEPNFVSRNKYRSSTSTFRSPSYEHSFCPEDLHAKPIKEEVRQMESDKWEFMFTFEEGQFDDA